MLNVFGAQVAPHAASLDFVPGMNGAPVHAGVECNRHAVLSDATLYVQWALHPTYEPEQIEHEESTDTDPVVYPSPAGQELIVHVSHALSLFAGEKVPATQDAHSVSFVLSPFVKPSPIAQDETECDRQLPVSAPVEYLPAVHTLHAESSDDVPTV